MNILIAPNSMKGSLNAAEFADAAEKGLRKASPVFNIRKVPVADGGDSTGPVLMKALAAKQYTVLVQDPLGRPVNATFGIAGETAIIEMAEASGWRLLKPDELNPEQCTSAGTGQLMLAAIERGCKQIILGAGGSATIDGGIGMLKALGFSFSDKEGNDLPGNVQSLSKVLQIKYPVTWPFRIEIIILTDVNNPLLGRNGAARVFGPQKGADQEMTDWFETALTRWAEHLEKISGRNIRDIPGMGAAGGLASGLVALGNAKVVQGADYILELIGIEEHIHWSDCVITGEGRLDRQSINRKAPVVLAEKAKAAGKPVIAVCGTFERRAIGTFDEIIPVCIPPVTLHESMKHAGELVESATRQFGARLIENKSGLKDLHLQLSETEHLIHSGQLKKAEQMISSIDGDLLAGYWYLKGMTDQTLMNWGNAINHYRRCLELDPGHVKAAARIEICRNILNFWNPQQFNP
jgi:glycerate 2-kinase